ncbi:hypothetical protein BOW51_08785 [Solemya velesiana gill symbiont]|uniref:Cyclic di-GMP phosphodiesterase VC-1295-like MASE10 domain-containing protein n=1 Tax=Solemya velesiana gill symbiont TaxID=1918948 RepID=A0A1T2KTE7_9GAMM|nr:hypothetical protein [Solemya velesiana gill symbiont]OOZ36127.1 hypothetical protein BOW51_08785 [Solemya velesiana gill symbiont]
MSRPALHYLATLVLIGIYGVQVCPFIDSLTPLQLVLLLILIIAIQYLLRFMVIGRLVDALGYKHQVSRAFQLEWGLFLLSGILLTAVNSLFYEFPVESGLKMILGFMTLGFLSPWTWRWTGSIGWPC